MCIGSCSNSNLYVGKIAKRKSVEANILVPADEVAEDPGLVVFYSHGEHRTRTQIVQEPEATREALQKDPSGECTELRALVAGGDPDQDSLTADIPGSGQLSDEIASGGRLINPQPEALPTPEVSERCSPKVQTVDGSEREPLVNHGSPHSIKTHAVYQEESTPLSATEATVANVAGCKTPSSFERNMQSADRQSRTKRRRSRQRSTLMGCETPSRARDPTLPLPDQPDELSANLHHPPVTAENQDDVTRVCGTKVLVSDDDMPIAKKPQVESVHVVMEAAQQLQDMHVQELKISCEEAPKEGSGVSTPANGSEDELNKIEELKVSPDMQGNRIADGTRAEPRFTDDTSMLKDFLNRAQARKAAKFTEVIPGPNTVNNTPRRSPRKILGHLDENSPSPVKRRDPAQRPDTPPGKTLTGLLGSDDMDELTGEPVIHRRSARKCPSTRKEAPGAPSFIPVRRPDGADPVVLQKSIAQELAIITRANTRRNKGTSKLPKIMLEALASNGMEEMFAKHKVTRSTKTVDWDEKLVYYRENSCSREEKEDDVETRLRVRRPRGLGSLNSTPAPKNMGSKTSSNGTPAPKRRGKTRA